MQIENFGVTELTADEAMQLDGGDGGAIVALGVAIVGTAVAGWNWGVSTLGPWLNGE